jgi:glutamyl-tRNA synthetase
MPLLRFALTGQARGPGVTTIMDLLGKDRTAERLANVVATL